MTGAQASYLKTLCEEAGAGFDDKLTKAKAPMIIGKMKNKMGCGIDH